MPDFKLWDSSRSRRFLLAPDYPDVARRIIEDMQTQVGDLRVDADGLALRGLLVRHLVMPGLTEDTTQIMGWLGSLSPDTYVNVMDQYYPAYKARTDSRYAAIDRRVYPEEMADAFEAARSAGLWRLDSRWRNVRPGRPALVMAGL